MAISAEVMTDEQAALIEREFHAEMELGLVPRVWLWKLLSDRHPDWDDDAVFRRALIAFPVPMQPYELTFH
jgi:hypothetical protein